MFEEIKALLAEEMSIDEEQITENAEFVNDLGFNSLESADLVVLCEDKYDVEFDDDKIRTITTVGELVNYLTELVAQK